MAGTQTDIATPGGAAPPPAPNGQDQGQTYTVTDTRSAGEAIAGLLFADDAPPPAKPDARGDTPSAAAQEGGEDTGAEQPTGDDVDQGQGEQQPAAIAAPASWNTDEQAEFARLPPAVQQTIARRERPPTSRPRRRALRSSESHWSS